MSKDDGFVLHTIRLNVIILCQDNGTRRLEDIGFWLLNDNFSSVVSTPRQNDTILDVNMTPERHWTLTSVTLLNFGCIEN